MAAVSINALPETILLELFTHVPARQLLLHCRPVCSLWRDLIDLATLWKRKCLREGFVTEAWDQPVADWKIFYFLRSLHRNLLHNPCAEEGFEFWSLDVNGGDEWKVEDLSKDQRKEFPNDQVKKYFVTSYYTCLKSQVVDLKAEGYWEELMDTTRPDIEVKDWFAARPDCGSKYQLCVQLLSSAHAPLGTFQPDPVTIQQKSDAKWREVSPTHSPTTRPASATSGFSTAAWTLTTGPAGTARGSPTAASPSGPRCPDRPRAPIHRPLTGKLLGSGQGGGSGPSLLPPCVPPVAFRLGSPHELWSQPSPKAPLGWWQEPAWVPQGDGASSSGGAGRSPRLPCEWVSKPGANLESCVSTGPATEWGLARCVASVHVLGGDPGVCQPLPLPCAAAPPLSASACPLREAQVGPGWGVLPVSQAPEATWLSGPTLPQAPGNPAQVTRAGGGQDWAPTWGAWMSVRPR